MSAFKNTEFVSLAHLTYILAVTCALLSVVALALWFIKKKRPELFLKKALGNLQILEIRSDIRLGTFAIITAYDKPHLVVVAKSGACMCALEPIVTSSVDDKQLNRAPE